MFPRLISLPLHHSFFLFGPRGTGKSTWLKHTFNSKQCLWLNLLDSAVEERFFHLPSELYSIVKALPVEISHVIIDEVQKVPKLLDEVHRLIEETNKIFVLTGSSARKLKKGSANLLAGRAFVSHLHSLSSFELKEAFHLEHVLNWGSLPKIFSLENDREKSAFLRAYSDTYLKEEVFGEQLVRKLQPFRRFLEVAAQCNGTIINYKNIARDVGVDDKTIKEYFSILEDTMIGFFLESFHHSFRKRLIEKPKFYFFDIGVSRCLCRRLSTSLNPSTALYGQTFEHFIILECVRLVSYFQPDYRLSFMQTTTGVEIDLIIERPSQPLLCIEIKSSRIIDPMKIKSFIRITKEIPNCEAVVLSQDPFMKRCEHVTCYPWQQGLEVYFSELSRT